MTREILAIGGASSATYVKRIAVTTALCIGLFGPCELYLLWKIY